MLTVFGVLAPILKIFTCMKKKKDRKEGNEIQIMNDSVRRGL